jgi:hypothetical protein
MNIRFWLKNRVPHVSSACSRVEEESLLVTEVVMDGPN